LGLWDWSGLLPRCYVGKVQEALQHVQLAECVQILFLLAPPYLRGAVWRNHEIGRELLGRLEGLSLSFCPLSHVGELTSVPSSPLLLAIELPDMIEKEGLGIDRKVR
jgi:hypothetical protein